MAARGGSLGVKGVEGDFTFRDEKGNIFSQQSFLDNRTKTTKPVLTDVSGRGAQPVGKLTPVGGMGQTLSEEVIAKGVAQTKVLSDREKELKSQQLEIEKKQADLAKAEADLALQSTKQAMTDFEAAQSISTIDNLLNKNLDNVYGVEEQFVYDRFRSQEGKDMLADRNQIIASLQLAQAGKLKGQGQVSEGERAILKDASTVLGDSSISPEKARDALQKARESIVRTMSIEAQADVGKSVNSDIDAKRQRLQALRAMQ